jgi:hypothetical protein
VTSAGDAYTSYNVVFDGLFVLDIGLSNEGDIRRVEALRDPGSMLGAAKRLRVPGNFGQRLKAANRNLLA